MNEENKIVDPFEQHTGHWNYILDHRLVAGRNRKLENGNHGHGYIFVRKGTRFGATTGLGKAANERDLKLLIVSPTNKILEEFCKNVLGADENQFAYIGSNERMCPYAKKNQLFGHHETGRCDICNFRETINCGFYKIANFPFNNYGITNFGITYSMLWVLLEGKSRMGDCRKQILKIISDVDIIFFDEFPEGIAVDVPGFFVDSALNIIDKAQYDKITEKILEEVDKELLNNLGDFVVDVRYAAKGLDESKDLDFKTYKNERLIKFKTASELGISCLKVFNEEIKASAEEWFGTQNLKNLDDQIKQILRTMLHEEVYITYKKDRHKVKKLYAFAKIPHPFLEVIRPWADKVVEKGGKVVATGMLVPEFPTFPFEEIALPDFNEIESKHYAIFDQRGGWYGGQTGYINWKNDEEYITGTIRKLQRKAKKVLVIAFNKYLYHELTNWAEHLIKDKQINEGDIFITYYRSIYTTGVELEYRTKVLISMPWIPEDSNIEQEILYKKFGITNEKLNRMSIGSQLMNSIGRGKDALGKEQSISFMLCGKEDQFWQYIPLEKQKRHYPNVVSILPSRIKMDDVIGCYYSSLRIIQQTERIVQLNELKDLPKIINMLYVADFNAKNGKMVTKVTDLQNQIFKGKLTADQIRDLIYNHQYLFPSHMKISNNFSEIWVFK